MSVLKSQKNLTVVTMLAVAVLAIVFWKVMIGPKKEEATKLGEQVEQVETSLAQHEAEIVAAEEARKEFPVDYQKLVVLGKAVPGDDDTASLLVQVNHIAKKAGVEFRDIELNSGAGEEETPVAAPVSGAPVSATEAAASLLPLGASIGPAGLGVMPYSLTFNGDFFQIADFIRGLDSLVKTRSEEVAVDGRLLTIDGFSLVADPDRGFPWLQADFGVTTYLTPPEQGVTAGATAEAPPTATPAATTIGGTP